MNELSRLWMDGVGWQRGEVNVERSGRRDARLRPTSSSWSAIIIIVIFLRLLAVKLFRPLVVS